MPPKSASSSSSAAVALSPEQTDLSWRVLSGLLKDSSERDDVKHAQVQQVAERCTWKHTAHSGPEQMQKATATAARNEGTRHCRGIRPCESP